VVLGVVVLEGFLGHVRLQGIHGVGQGGQLVFHVNSLMGLKMIQARARLLPESGNRFRLSLPKNPAGGNS
jgi:hypothetical protein